ncbi:MAG: carbonic anhydrase, partial [Dehalococcoidia bacterium]
MEPATAIQALLDGYTRFATGRPAHPHRTHARQAEVAAAPQPIAIVLGCMDARVPPEVIFDQGIGDLLVVRVAGAIVTDAVLG